MSPAAELIARHGAELRGISPALPDLFADAAAALEERLGEEGLRAWLRIGLGLARLCRRSPEVPIAFFEASRELDSFDIAAFGRWADAAAELAGRAPQAAAAFLASTPAALAHLEVAALDRWAGQGRRLCRGGWKSAKLAARFFRVGPELLGSLALEATDQLAEIVGRVAQRSDEMALLCLLYAPSRLSRLSEDVREPFLRLTQAVSDAAWTDAHRCLERGPALLENVAPDQRAEFLAMVAAAAGEAGRDTFSLFLASAEALGDLEAEAQTEAIDFARRLSPFGARAAIESLIATPRIRRHLNSEQAQRWLEVGLQLLTDGQTREVAESYFRLESALAEEVLGELGARVELTSVGSRLRLYAKALSGAQVLVQPTEVLVGRNVGWASETAATCDGVSIFLPRAIELFDDRDANFQLYKVQTTHQAARLEFGSFRYCFGADGEHLVSTTLERERRRRGDPVHVEGSVPSAITPIQRLYDLFDDRRLISDLFALAEDARIDACVTRQYPGVRGWLRRFQKHEARQRPDVRSMPLREAFLENLTRAALHQPDTIRWPQGLATRLERAVATLRVLERSGATVQDAVEVATLLYDLAIAIPNLPSRLIPGAWRALDEDAIAALSELTDSDLEGADALPEGKEVPYRGLRRPHYQGEFKPELVQLLEALADAKSSQTGQAPFDRERILELLANSAEIEPDHDAEAEGRDLGTLLANIEHEASKRADDEDKGEGAAAHDDADDEAVWFRYDEWDFKVNDYRRDWCRIGERVAEEGGFEFYNETLRRHHGLLLEIRRQFERMRPESLKKVKRLEDGHEIDLDRAVEFHADKKAGAAPLARIYTRRNKLRRDVAVGFLLDMSGSTSEVISPSVPRPSVERHPSVQQTAATSTNRGKRIIDIERESTVLVIEALEAIGDAYGIYGFSGHGRENVEFYVIKDLDEAFDDTVRRRIDKIEPRRSTRMGAAIRHATTKLSNYAAKVKILILVSDGRPEDEEYGRDGQAREYAVHDTKRALVEAKRKGISPFLITIDRLGHDYLRHMCDELGYEVVADIESLPRRLPKLYRYLAAE